MPTDSPDDELNRTKMSFSEHLEELRSALIKSIGALVAGTLVGLLLGWWVVDFVQMPLRESLVNFYRNQAETKNRERFDEMAAAGIPVPADAAASAARLADAGFVAQDIYVDPRLLAQAIGTAEPPAPLAEPTGLDDLVLLRIYTTLASDPRLQAITLSGQEPFMAYMKASIITGATLASPLIFFFIWDFVAAGLYRHERKTIYMYLPISLGLFFSGAAIAFFFAFDFVLDFLFWFNEQMGVNPTPQLSEWMSFVLMLPLGFGISFQLPLVMVLLERIGVFTIESYWSKWRVAVLVIAVVSMFLTPADPGSMLLMGCPLVVLYFGGILLCKYLPRHATPPHRQPK